MKTWLILLLIASLSLPLLACDDDDDDDDDSTPADDDTGDDDTIDDDLLDDDTVADDDTVDDDVTDDDTSSPQIHLEMEIIGSPAVADGSEEVNVIVRALDELDQPVPEVELAHFYWVAGFSTGEVTYESTGESEYTAVLTATCSVEMQLRAADEAGHTADGSIQWLAGEPASLDLSVPKATVDGSVLATQSRIILRDSFFNPAAAETADIELTPSCGAAGTVTTEPDLPYYQAELTSPGYAIGTLSAALAESDIEDEQLLVFPPQCLHTGDEEQDFPGVKNFGVIEVYFRIEVPEGMGPLDTYFGNIFFDHWELAYLNYVDEPDDPCDFTVQDIPFVPGSLSHGGECAGADGTIKAGRLRFWSFTPDSRPLVRMSGIYMINGASYFYTSPDWIENWAEHFEWPVQFKGTRRFDLRVWVAPGAASAAEMQADVEQADEIMAHNARRDVCPWFFKYQAEVTLLTEGQWAQIAGDDGLVDAGERGAIEQANGGETYDSSAYNVYVGGIFEQNAVGVTDQQSEACFVAADQDERARTLARELGRLIADVPAAWDDEENLGAKNPQNLYNPLDPGILLSPAQCELFSL